MVGILLSQVRSCGLGYVSPSMFAIDPVVVSARGKADELPLRAGCAPVRASQQQISADHNG